MADEGEETMEGEEEIVEEEEGEEKEQEQEEGDEVEEDVDIEGFEASTTEHYVGLSKGDPIELSSDDEILL